MSASLKNFKIYTKRSITSFIGLILILLLMQSAVYAIARGYTTDDSGLQNGMMVALSTSADGSNKVERASQENDQKVVGVVTNLDNSLVTVASGSAKVLVESEGEVGAYVDDINGQPKQGDLLVISPLKGILMKAGSGSTSPILGIAAADFSSASSETYNVQDSKGAKNVQIAKVKINLNRQGAANVTAPVDSSLSRLGRSIVGKDVGEIRVVVALIIFFIVLVAEGGILYGAISSAITALGRNPMGRKIIRREMLKVIGIAFVVLLLGLAAIYGILWI